MPGDPKGEDYSLVTTYHRRPVLQCYWCDSHVMLRRSGRALVLDLNHKAIRHLRPGLAHDRMVSLLLDQDEAEETLVGLIPSTGPEAPTPHPTYLTLGEFAPDLPPESPEAAVTAPDFTPALLDDLSSRTPVDAGTELVSGIPLDARALDHDSLIHMAAQVGWVSHRPAYRIPEWMNFKLPEVEELSPLRTRIRAAINMMKYFRVNPGTSEQRHLEAVARRERRAEYLRRIKEDKIRDLSPAPAAAIEYKPETV